MSIFDKWGSTPKHDDGLDAALQHVKAQVLDQEQVMSRAEGTTIAHDLSSSGGSFVYTTAKARNYTSMSPLIIQEGDKKIIVGEMLQRLEYILQRAVPNYDELSEQFNAIKDIERSNNDIR